MPNHIDKIAWLHVEGCKVLFVRSFGKDKPYSPGGKREEGETDEQALIREIKEELGVDIKSETIKYMHTVRAQAHGKPEGTLVQVACYDADFEGELSPQSEIEELEWMDSSDIPRATEPGKLILAWLKEQNLID